MSLAVITNFHSKHVHKIRQQLFYSIFLTADRSKMLQEGLLINSFFTPVRKNQISLRLVRVSPADAVRLENFL